MIRTNDGTPYVLHRLEPGKVQLNYEPDGEPFYLVSTDAGQLRMSYRDVLRIEAFGGTWSNTEEMARQFYNITLKPWLTDWAWAYSRCLLSPEERAGAYAEAVTDDLLRTDTAACATAFGQYRSMGVMTANEVRAAQNLPPLAGGDKLENPNITTTTTTTAPAGAKEEQAA